MRQICFAVVFAWVTGCVGSNQVVCPGLDGTVCPDGTKCAQVTLVPMEAPVTLCVTSGQLEACAADDAAGKACAIGDVMPIAGTCHDHVCLTDACGNQLIDSTEICDDGNTQSGDGCASDCRSDELCGNAHVDSLRGEACDDGNGLGRDGCAVSCLAEVPSWTSLEESQPISRDRYALAFDVYRHRTVLFGGADPMASTALGGTFEWDGAHWSSVPTDIAPAPRRQATMAYDPAGHVSILFGGYNGGVLGDTWEWDGATWVQRTPMHVPPARAGHAMVYDPTRKAIVVFGGYAQTPGTAQLQDTWAWTGTDWVEVASATKPPARESHAMAYDARRDVIVMFGGRAAIDLGDVWELRAGGWTQVTVAGVGPMPRNGHAMAFDGEEVVLAAGASSLVDRKDAWTFNGTRWLSVSDLNYLMHGITAVYDSTRDRVVVVSTEAVSSGVPLEWNGTTWGNTLGTSLLARTQVRSGHIAVAMPPRRDILIFGGDDQGANTKTWLWNGDWRVTTSTVVPTPDRYAAAAYDSRLDKVVMFGGTARTTGVLADTWLWSTAGWAAGPAGPPARDGAAMAYDPVRQQAVMFGGANAGVLGDTWLWNSGSSTWTQGPATGPSARRGAAMAFDPIARKVVLFGGLKGAVASDESWEWDGTSWTQVTTAIAPIARSGAGLAWDAARKRLVLFGGRAGGPVGSSSLVDDTWEASRDQTGKLVWTQLDPIGKPEARADHAVIAGLDGNGVLVIAGIIADTTPVPTRTTDVWRLRWAASSAYESCGDIDTDADGLVGCADPDCWASCTPLCPPGVTSCDPGPRCGDNVCNAAIETCYLCPSDCSVCAPVCGDLNCSGGETHASCPGDCP